MVFDARQADARVLQIPDQAPTEFAQGRLYSLGIDEDMPPGGLLLMLSLAGAPLTIGGTTVDAMPDAAGVYDIEVKTASGPRRWTLALPATISAGTPLVLVLHYGGQPTRFYGRPLVEDLFMPAWHGFGAVYVAPESTGGRWEDEANEAFVMALLDHVQQRYGLDRDNAVVAGYSMGAIGSWHLIHHNPERFRAALPLAGFPTGPLANAVPVYTLATASDEIFDHAALSAAVDDARGRGHDIDFVTVDARGHYDIGGFRAPLGDALPWLQRHLDAR